MSSTMQHSTTAQVHHQIYRREETAVHTHKQLDSEFGQLTCPSNLDLQPHHLGDVGCCARSKSIIRITTSNIAPVIHADGQLLDYGKGVNISPSFNQTETYGDPVLDELKQGDGAARSCHQLGPSCGTLGFDTEERASTSPQKGLLMSAERQARMNLTNGEIHRLMPRDRKIRFNVDIRSFSDANIPDWAIELFIKDVLEVAEVFTRERLGITFLYTTVPGREVFSIRYRRTLGRGTLAHSFFPSDPPGARKVLVSPNAMYLAYGFGHSNHMRAILAHEFTHILGFRHWHAGSDPVERRAPSMVWPGTTDDDWHTIMYTPFHSRMDFSEDDFWVIRDVYSRRNGSIVGGCMIVDVDPHARRFLS